MYRSKTEGFYGRDLVGRDLVACSRFWARDRVATAVVRGASPFWKSSFVRATNRHGRDHPANLPLSLGVVGRPRRVAEAPGCHWFSTSRRSWPLVKGPLSSSRRECRRLLLVGTIPTTTLNVDTDDFNDMCEVPASEDAEMMGWDTYDDDYVGS